MRIKSFAKINLGLEVARKREDGYHEIRTLFQSVDFFDTLEFTAAREGHLVLKGDDLSIPWDGRNLIYRAARILMDRFKPRRGVEIRVEKRIPAGKGLGGGSSNAAMTLYALDKLWGLGLGKARLTALGSLLGADVPYFFEGGLCLGQGRGDVLTLMKDLPPLGCVLVFPEVSIMTPAVYAEAPVCLTSDFKDSKINRFLESHDYGVLKNDLEETVFRLHPHIKAIKSLFLSLEVELSLVSGTGSAVFGLFLEKAKAEDALNELKKEHKALLVDTLPRELYRDSLKAGV